MTFRTAGRVRETSTTTGTGTYTLDGAPTGFQAFSVLGASNVCPYVATDGTNWEEGIGTVLTGPNRLERTVILASTNSNNAVNWSPGTRTLRCAPIGGLGYPYVDTVSVAGSGTMALPVKNQAANVLIFNGALTGARVVEVDATARRWAVVNACSGAFTLTMRVSGQTGVVIPPGSAAYGLVCNGVDVFLESGGTASDYHALLYNNADPTKKALFDLSQITTGTTRTYTLPNATDTLVGRIATQTLETKTFNLGSNTLSGTKAQFDTACNDGNFVFQGSTLSGCTIDADSNTVTNIDQANLKTTTGSVSSSAAAGANLTLPGGSYGFYPQVQVGGSSGDARTGEDFTFGSGYQTNIFLSNASDGAFATLAQQRYIQACPPYDLGDGDVALFLFALVNGNGKVLATYAAEDPPWANNGPTSIRPDFRDSLGREWQVLRPQVDLARLRAARGASNELAVLRDELERVKAARLDPAAYQRREITQALKQADMALIPHPFLQNNLGGLSVVLLDPPSEMCDSLRELQLAGESVGTLLHQGYLRVDNQPLRRYAPPGVMPVAFKWKP